jgi:hypothetical protein
MARASILREKTTRTPCEQHMIVALDSGSHINAGSGAAEGRRLHPEVRRFAIIWAPFIRLAVYDRQRGDLGHRHSQRPEHLGRDTCVPWDAGPSKEPCRLPCGWRFARRVPRRLSICEARTGDSRTGARRQGAIASLCASFSMSRCRDLSRHGSPATRYEPWLRSAGAAQKTANCCGWRQTASMFSSPPIGTLSINRT